MAALGRFFGKFFGRTIGDAASFAIGGSISRTIDPVLQQVENEAWAAAVAAGVTKPLDAGLLAAGVAQGQVDPGTAHEWAAQQGYDGKAFAALVEIANVGPGMAQAFNLWRRYQIDQPGFYRALTRLGLEPEWISDLWAVRMDVLDPAQLAAAVHRDLIPDPGLLIGEKPGPDRKVPVFPPVEIDAEKEAHAAGYDLEHLRALVGLQGLPMGSHEAAQAEFRGVITKDDYLAAIAQGNTRNEWAEAIFDQSRQIVTSHDGIEDHLRGWSDADAMYAQTARHGMSREDTDILFRIAGRPLSWHQVFIGLRRGGTYDGPITDIDPAFLKALRESNIRPEWYNLAWAQRYSYPAAFVLKALTVGGDLTGAEVETILLYEGWEPTLAAKVSAAWSAPKTPAGTDKHVTSATTSLITSTRRAYVGGSIDKAQAIAALTTANVPVTSQQSLFTLWDAERTVETAPPPA